MHFRCLAFNSIIKDVRDVDAQDYVNYLKAKCKIDGVDDDTLLAFARTCTIPALVS